MNSRLRSTAWNRVRYMSRFDKIGADPEREPEKITEIRGTYCCQICNEPVYKAQYMPVVGQIRYICGLNHESIIKDVYF